MQNKTIVCIIEDEMIINYLFVKDLYTDGDKVLFVTQYKLNYLAERYRSLFQYIKDIDVISLNKDGDEDLLDVICAKIRESLTKREEESYYVNLSGGTRLMSIAVQQVFEKHNSKFFFIPIDRNVIINSQIDDNYYDYSDKISKINHKLTVTEYLKVNDVISRREDPQKDEEYAKHFLALFIGGGFSNREFNILDDLRDLRNENIHIREVRGLDKFLRYINFPVTNRGLLSQNEVQYLTGGWFEEYIYYMIKSTIPIDDIALGVRVQRKNSDFQNELDVVFTLNNNLYAIECKTGVGKRSLYNQIVYKACALKEALLGIRSFSFIFSLNEDHRNNLEQTARNMGIYFCDRNFAEDPEAFKRLIRVN